jgi:pimeloyl-ACP methyl ester carboxylesterase
MFAGDQNFGEGQVTAAIADGGTMDRRPKLKTIKAPTVVLHGADDPLIPVEHGRDAAANIPEAEVRIIPGMGHDIPIALVQEFADAITKAASRANGAKAAR